MSSPTLDDLAFQYHSDKGTRPFVHGDKPPGYVHGYTPFYEEIFSNRRDEPLAILDIGAWGENEGGSALMWRDYFPKGHVYALDYWAAVEGLNVHDRITAFQCDLDHEHQLLVKLEQLGVRFDIVIEDASHYPKQQARTLLNVSSHLREGFTYVIEDAGCGENDELLASVRVGHLPHVSPFEWNILSKRLKTMTIVTTNDPSTLVHIV